MKKDRAFLVILICFVTLLTVGFVAAIPTIELYLFNGHKIYEGIDKYNYGLSSVSLCNYLDLIDHQKKGLGDGDFVKEHTYSEVFFRYESEWKGGYGHEEVLLSLAYDKTTYQEAKEDIISKPGFSEKIKFSYGDFVFCLNETAKLAGNNAANYDLNSNNPYINWVQLVGCSESRQEISFIGFFYEYRWRSGFWKYDKSYFSFQGWDAFFDTWFGFYEWD